MSTPFTGNVTAEAGFDNKNNIDTASLFNANTGTQSGAHIAFPGRDLSFTILIMLRSRSAIGTSISDSKPS
jgi:hypothetical protein